MTSPNYSDGQGSFSYTSYTNLINIDYRNIVKDIFNPSSKKLYELQTTSHFLPKFDNQDSDKRLAKLIDNEFNKNIDRSAHNHGCLHVSKKHSGSLVMAPPFYSKNSTGNHYSRVGAILLFNHFDSVWPGEGEEKFYQWWDNAEAHGFCYSFETVVPRILQDHGATPSCAYMILTSVALTREERFMSPSELLAEATIWRLPLNEVWIFSGEKTNTIEDELHARRWTMTDDDSSVVLDKFLNKGHDVQRFLRHSETQGQVLEGFVLMVLDCDISTIADSITAYNKLMAPYHDTALASARRIGQDCLNPLRANEFLESIDQMNLKPLCLAGTRYHEPIPLNLTDYERDTLWRVIVDRSRKGKLNFAFNRLEILYKEHIKLRLYCYKGNPQFQVSILNDEIFYSWPLHMADNSTSPIFRGMVITLMPTRENDLIDDVTQNSLTMPFPNVKPVKILGISKLKCLNYMWRTFAVRNAMPTLVNSGPDAYLAKIRSNFFKIWRIPEQFLPMLDDFLSRWALFVSSLSADKQQKLLIAYLSVLEDEFLPVVPYPLTSIDLTGSTASTLPKSVCNGVLSKVPHNIATVPLRVTVINLSGVSIDSISERLQQLGLNPKTKQLDSLKCGGRNGTWLSYDKIPRGHIAKSANAFLVLEPRDADLRGQSDDNIKRAKGIFSNSKKNMQKVLSDSMICFGPCDAHEWLSSLDARASELLDSESQEQRNNKKPVCYILCVMALPPGGGKSSLFEIFNSVLLETHADSVNFCHVSSDSFNKRPKFEAKFCECLENTNISGSADVSIIGYDKNIPDRQGIFRFISVLEPLIPKLDIRVVSVVPENLDGEIFWRRIEMRDPKSHIGMTLGTSNTKKAFNKFLAQCITLSTVAAQSPGAIVTDAFTRENVSGLAQLRTLITDILKKLQRSESIGVPIEEFMTWWDTSNGRKIETTQSVGFNFTNSENCDWCCALIDGHSNRHVTLIPPSRNGNKSSESERRAILRQLESIPNGKIKLYSKKYHVAISEEKKNDGMEIGEGNDCGAQSNDSSTGRKNGRKRKRVAFWEIDHIEGLPSSINLGEQSEILHITDAAGISNAKPKEAGEVLRELKKKDNFSNSWTIRTEDHQMELDATIAFVKR